MLFILSMKSLPVVWDLVVYYNSFNIILYLQMGKSKKSKKSRRNRSRSRDRGARNRTPSPRGRHDELHRHRRRSLSPAEEATNRSRSPQGEPRHKSTPRDPPRDSAREQPSLSQERDGALHQPPVPPSDPPHAPPRDPPDGPPRDPPRDPRLEEQQRQLAQQSQIDAELHRQRQLYYYNQGYGAYDYGRGSLPYPYPSHAPFGYGQEVGTPPPLPANPPDPPPPPPPPQTPVEDTQDSASSSAGSPSSDLNFKDKLGLVAQLQGLELVSEVRDTTYYSSRREEPATLRLPGATDFQKLVRDYHKEVVGRDKTSVTGIGTLPPWTSPVMSSYKVADSSWSTNALQFNPSLLQSVIFPGEKPPVVTLDQARCAKVEGCVRDFISVANVGYHFSRASSTSIRQVQEALRDPPTDEEGLSKLWNQLEDVQELLHSVGRAQEDVASMAIRISGNLTLLRRDAWLEKVAKGVRPELVQSLRRCDLQGELLFDQEVVDLVNDKTEHSDAVKRQDKMMYGISDIQKKVQANKSGFQFERKSQAQNKGNEGGRKPLQEKQNNFGGGRGGGQRGSGQRGRGRGNQFRRPDNKQLDPKKVE